MKIKYFRKKKNMVKVTGTGDDRKYETTGYESISQAKKSSFKIQMSEDGALGRGSVQLTEDPFS